MINDEFRQDTLHCQHCYQGHKLTFQSVVVNIPTIGFSMQKSYILRTGCIFCFIRFLEETVIISVCSINFTDCVANGVCLTTTVVDERDQKNHN
jgi:hypothetical protein